VRPANQAARDICAGRSDGVLLVLNPPSSVPLWTPTYRSRFKVGAIVCKKRHDKRYGVQWLYQVFETGTPSPNQMVGLESSFGQREAFRPADSYRKVRFFAKRKFAKQAAEHAARFTST
jgi:hypothetical protein